MNYTSFLIEALNELIKLNKYRINGYMQAAKEMAATDVFLKEMCVLSVQDGEKNIKELSYQISKLKLNNGLPQEIINSSKAIKLWNKRKQHIVLTIMN